MEATMTRSLHNKPTAITSATLMIVGFSLCLPTVSKADPPAPDRVAIEKLVDELARMRAGPETEKAVADLASNGSAAVEEIGRQLSDRPSDFARVHYSVLVLKKVNTEQSRGLLRRVALGEMTGGNANLADWAAGALLACDPTEVWKLLAATNPQVLVTSLNAVGKQTLNRERFGLLVANMKHDDTLVSGLSSMVIAQLATGELADEAAASVIQALKAVPARTKDKDTKPIAGFISVALTPAESLYRHYISALVAVGVKNDTLRKLAKGLTGKEHDAIVVALAARGDTTVRLELIKVVLDQEAAMLRVWAVDGMRTIGTPDDLPLLRKLAESDTFSREAHNCLDGKRDPNFVVRNAAKDAISAIEKKKK
jgi:hypothetical protein